MNKAVVTDPRLYQWIDLGILSEPCITLPDTCGPEGAAVSVWVKIHSCPSGYGLMSSLRYSGKTGFLFFCNGPKIRYVFIAVWITFEDSLLPPANEVCQGYVSTGACLSTGGHVWLGVHAWWGGMCGREACVAGGMCGRRCTWQASMHGKGHVWHTSPWQILRDMVNKRRYASYWNAFLFTSRSSLCGGCTTNDLNLN